MILRSTRRKATRVEPGEIGIPRALSYFYHPGLWESFFASLGFTPVISAATSRRTVERAGAVAESEHCLPVKLFQAHLHELAEKVDRVFVPRVLSTLDGHVSCPKLAALPDVAAIEFEVEILTVDIDQRRRSLRDTLASLARSLGADRRTAKSIASRAVERTRSGQRRSGERRPSHDRYLILGHPYTLGDGFISGRVFGTLRKLGVHPEWGSFADAEIPDSFVKWDTMSRMYHELESLAPGEYAGVIQISTFNCGCDSMLLDHFRSVATEKRIPYLVLMFDEHTSLGGVDTRLEAFVDSIRQ
jgi:predicted nucleotide-binding protein (sugar kinase/HSP70/actin superfamily)